MNLNLSPKITPALILMLTALSTSSCSLFGKKDQPEYYGVPEASPLKIPEGLDTPTSQTALTIDYPPVPLAETELSAVPPRVLANQSEEASNSKIRWAADGIYILVEDSADSVKRRLGYVIERSGMEMQGPVADGEYRFEYEHPENDRDTGFVNWVAFWRKNAPDYSGTYQTLLQPDGNNTRVYLIYADGGEVPIDAAEHVLAILKERLG